jgi:hypothetical protein
LHEKKPIATKPDRLLSASSIATFVTVASSTLRPCVEMLWDSAISLPNYFLSP